MHADIRLFVAQDNGELLLLLLLLEGSLDSQSMYIVS